MLQSASISFCIMVVIGYLLLAGTVFQRIPTLHGFCRYTVAMALNFPLATTLVWVGLKLLGLPMTFAAPSAAIGMAVINFFMSRWAVIGQRTWT